MKPIRFFKPYRYSAAACKCSAGFVPFNMGNTNYHISLHPDGIYHVLNRANGNKQLFYNDENRHFFLRKFQLHVAPVADLAMPAPAAADLEVKW